MTTPNTGDPTLDWYTRFVASAGPAQSELYTRWARGIVDDPEVLALLGTLPRPKRQPHLVFAVSRLLGAPENQYSRWRSWLVANWPAMLRETSVRFTQTNEPGRCAPLIPLLAQIEGPIALLEVGTSAGLCLYPARYSYEFSEPWPEAEILLNAEHAPTPGQPYDSELHLDRVVRLDPVDGPSTVTLQCAVTGTSPLPTAVTSETPLPTIVWRAGLDLTPLDVADPTDRRWLQVSVGPEQHDRRERLDAAIEIVRAEPPTLVAADAAGSGPSPLAALAAEAPADATLVILTLGVLVYLSPAERESFTREVTALTDRGARWISLEGAGVLPEVAQQLERSPAPASGLFPLAIDQRPVAWCGPHGQSLHWIAGATPAADPVAHD